MYSAESECKLLIIDDGGQPIASQNESVVFSSTCSPSSCNLFLTCAFVDV
jgi:hypothetical protein